MSTAGYSVAQARKMGIETVYQQSSFGESQPLWRNIFTGRHLTNRLGFIRVREEKRETLKIMKEMVGLSGAGITPDSAVGRLSGGERQGLAMGRAMYFNASIILLDEPATALSVKEVDRVLGFIGKIKREGKSAIMALGMTVVIVAGEMDMSFPSVMALCGLVFAGVYLKSDNAVLAAALCLIAGMAAGLLNGILVVLVGIPSIIATIGTQFLWRGLTMLLCGGLAKNMVAVREEPLHALVVGRAGEWLPAQSLWCLHHFRIRLCPYHTESHCVGMKSVPGSQ